jgi:hypothetical protein
MVQYCSVRFILYTLQTVSFLHRRYHFDINSLTHSLLRRNDFKNEPNPCPSTGLQTSPRAINLGRDKNPTALSTLRTSKEWRLQSNLSQGWPRYCSENTSHISKHSCCCSIHRLLSNTFVLLLTTHIWCMWLSVKESDDRIIALKFLVVPFLWNFVFHFGSVFKIKNLE